MAKAFKFAVSLGIIAAAFYAGKVKGTCETIGWIISNSNIRELEFNDGIRLRVDVPDDDKEPADEPNN